MNVGPFYEDTVRNPARFNRAHRRRIRFACGPTGISRRGAAVVELAMVCPFLMVMVLGICELGQALKVDAILSEAVRAGCAAGTRPGCSNVDVLNDTQTVLTSNGISASSASVTILVNDVAGEVAAATTNDKITVSVSIPVSRIIIANTLTYFRVNSKLSQSLTMLKQG